MSVGRVRSFALLVIAMIAAVTVTTAVPAQAAAAQSTRSAKKAETTKKTSKRAKSKRSRSLKTCSTRKVRKIKTAAAKKAKRISKRRRHSTSRRKAYRASYVKRSLRKAGCRTTAKKRETTSKKKTTTSPTSAGGKSTTNRPVSYTPPATSSNSGRSGSGSGTTAPSTGGTTSPSVAPSPQTSQSWWTGIQGGANDWDARVGANLGARVVRVEFSIGTPVSAMRAYVADYADRGVRILPLAGFHGRIPSVSEAQSLAAWTKEFGPGGSFWASRPSQAGLAITHIEFGNETSFAYQGTQQRGGDYARRVRDAYNAIQSSGNPRVGLLVQADNANQSDDWVGQMYAAVSNVHAYAAGWTVHPYGPRSRWQNRIDDVIADTAKHGAPSTIPVDITEWGLSTDNGRCLDDNYGWDRCMSYGEAASALTGSVAEMRARYGGRIRHFLVYNGRDLRDSGQTGDREHYFGLTKTNEQDKGAFTAAARELMAIG